MAPGSGESLSLVGSMSKVLIDPTRGTKRTTGLFVKGAADVECAAAAGFDYVIVGSDFGWLERFAAEKVSAELPNTESSQIAFGRKTQLVTVCGSPRRGRRLARGLGDSGGGRSLVPCMSPKRSLPPPGPDWRTSPRGWRLRSRLRAERFDIGSRPHWHRLGG